MDHFDSRAYGLKVVRKESATKDGPRVQILSIPENHQDMCKFAGKEHVGYKRVLGTLQELCDDMITSGSPGKSMVIPSSSAFRPH